MPTLRKTSAGITHDASGFALVKRLSGDLSKTALPLNHFQTTNKAMTKKPNITISTLDLERIETLLDAMPVGSFPERQALEDELARANIVEPKDIPDDVVTMNSTVIFKELKTSTTYSLTLVYPKDVNQVGDYQPISVFAPVGSALLGLSIGDEIEWPKPGGGVTKLHIDRIIYQPERAGELHR